MTPGSTFLALVTAWGMGCDAPGPFTKAGTTPVSGHVIAADPKVLPLGSIVEIDGLGVRQVQDVGPKVKGRHLDEFMDDCDDAVTWGRKWRLVRVLHVPASSREAARVAPSARAAAAAPAARPLRSPVVHRGTTAQAPRRAPGLPGAGVVTAPAPGLERGSTRLLASQTSSPERVAPAARSLGSGDPRETWRLTMLLAALLSAAATGTLLLILLAVLDPKARVETVAAVRLWWALLREGGSALAEDVREAVADWRERRAARTVGR